MDSKTYTSKTGPVPVPTAQELPWRLSDGKVISIDGVAGDGDRFSINLMDGPDYGSDRVLLHFNPRFDGSETVLNSYDGNWGEEQKIHSFPFEQGSRFDLRIEVKKDGYHFMVEGKHYGDTFHHRLPMDSAIYLYIFGDCSINNITFDDVYNPTHRKPAVPFTASIPKGLSPARCIFIKGTAKDGAERFNVNLVCGPNFSGDDIALHMDNRFSFGQGNTVVRTHRKGGDWGDEDDGGPFPFVPGTPFEISIVVTEPSYLLANKDDHIAEFPHRIPYKQVSHLHIDGDVDLAEVRFVTP